MPMGIFYSGQIYLIYSTTCTESLALGILELTITGQSIPKVCGEQEKLSLQRGTMQPVTSSKRDAFLAPRKVLMAVFPFILSNNSKTTCRLST